MLKLSLIHAEASLDAGAPMATIDSLTKEFEKGLASIAKDGIDYSPVHSGRAEELRIRRKNEENCRTYY